MPPVPKPAAQRRRRNITPAVEKLPAEGRRGAAPKPKTDSVLGAVAMDYWRSIWSSPMAAVFQKADVFPLTRLAVLVDERERLGNDFDGDAEIRQMEDRFGLSPLARRRLQWEITQSETAAPKPTGAAGDRFRGRLHAVG